MVTQEDRFSHEVIFQGTPGNSVAEWLMLYMKESAVVFGKVWAGDWAVEVFPSLKSQKYASMLSPVELSVNWMELVAFPKAGAFVQMMMGGG
jgi:hypothetical protein